MELHQLPQNLTATRDSLHQLAYFVLSPARFRRTGRMGLVPTPGGFGTPQMDGRVIRIKGAALVDEAGSSMATAELTTLGAALEFVGEPFEEKWFDGFGDELASRPLDWPLDLDREAASFIGELFAFGERVLHTFSEVAPGGITEIWLWPEHFDLATEAGAEERGAKASYGVSPGDHAHDEPYFYVSAWGEIDRADGFWNDSAFNGASLAYRDVVSSGDPVDAVIRFFLAGFEKLNAGFTP
jgi:hypothetical protein